MLKLQRPGLTVRQEMLGTERNMKYYVVLDTNVVVSALFNLSSVPVLFCKKRLRDV